MAGALSTFSSEWLKQICNGLGYPESKVISVRINTKKATVVFEDEKGNLRKQVHQVVAY